MQTVSVHIVTYNSADDIEACLKAVYQQTYPVNQVIVVDNASTDSTRNLLEQYSGWVTVVCNTVNVGFSGGHNQAIRQSQADYCLVLNPDVAMHPDYLHELIACFESDPDSKIGSLTGKLLLKSHPDLVDSCGIMINKARRAFDLGTGEHTDLWQHEQKVFGVSGAAALYKRAMLEDICFQGEYFDEGFFAYKEDVDLAWRSQLFGWSAVFVPKAIALHERGWKPGSRGKQPLFIRRLSYINRYRMIFKNDRLVFLGKHLVPFLLHECLSLGYVLLRKPRLLSAWRSIIRDRTRIRQWRKFIQSRAVANSNKMYEFFKH